jgi:hypothetical protein
MYWGMKKHHWEGKGDKKKHCSELKRVRKGERAKKDREKG